MQYVYVTFLMRGDGYLPGALVLGYALKAQSTHKCICLVTADVSYHARYALSVIYDEIHEINELRIKSNITTGRNDRSVLMTRFEALKLTQYDKIVLLDADVLPLAGYDELFSLKTPAGIIMEQKIECYSNAISATNDNTWSWHKIYHEYLHGEPIPKEITDRVKQDPSNMGVNAGLWVLTPNEDEYTKVITTLKMPDVITLVKKFPWPEMQLATLLWSGSWTNIDIRYCSIGGYPHPNALYGIHFAGIKPWQIKNRSAKHYAKYPDFVLWRQFFMSMYWSYRELRDYSMLCRLYEFFLGCID